MPRRPPPDLTIVPLVPGKGRPEAPKTLDQVEARAWNDAIDSLPGQWVDPAGQLDLRQRWDEQARGLNQGKTPILRPPTDQGRTLSPEVATLRSPTC
jgi:hypothetical protein